MWWIEAFFLFTWSTFCLFACVIWLSEKDISIVTNGKNLPGLSVLIPIRNEAEKLPVLLESLEGQTCPPEFFEIIFIDDGSTDQSRAIISKYISYTSLHMKLLDILPGEGSPKKRAIELGIKDSKFNLIATTDGDCILPENWISTLQDMLSTKHFIFGPVIFKEEPNSLWHTWQKIEFSSLIGSAAVGSFLGRPFMASAANMAFRKSTFDTIGGYDGNRHIASGDDEFLLKKIVQQVPQGVQFLKSKKMAVVTQAKNNLFDFYHQRLRWAGKWKYQKGKMPAVYVFFVHLFMLSALFSGHWDLVLLKIITEAIFLVTLVRFFYKTSFLTVLPVTQLSYPLYVLIMGISVLFNKKYTWKNREHS